MTSIRTPALKELPRADGLAPGFSPPIERGSARDVLTLVCVALAASIFASVLVIVCSVVSPSDRIDRVAYQVNSDPEGFAVCMVAGVCVTAADARR